MACSEPAICCGALALRKRQYLSERYVAAGHHACARVVLQRGDGVAGPGRCFTGSGAATQGRSVGSTPIAPVLRSMTIFGSSAVGLVADAGIRVESSVADEVAYQVQVTPQDLRDLCGPVTHNVNLDIFRH